MVAGKEKCGPSDELVFLDPLLGQVRPDPISAIRLHKIGVTAGNVFKDVRACRLDSDNFGGRQQLSQARSQGRNLAIPKNANLYLAAGEIRERNICHGVTCLHGFERRTAGVELSPGTIRSLAKPPPPFIWWVFCLILSAGSSFRTGPVPAICQAIWAAISTYHKLPFLGRSGFRALDDHHVSKGIGEARRIPAYVDGDIRPSRAALIG